LQSGISIAREICAIEIHEFYSSEDHRFG